VVLFGQAALVGLPAEPDPGVLVVAVQPGGAADRAGLTPGDRVSDWRETFFRQARRASDPWWRRSKAPPIRRSSSSASGISFWR
jgi:hypothetical protein